MSWLELQAWCGVTGVSGEGKRSNYTVGRHEVKYGWNHYNESPHVRTYVVTSMPKIVYVSIFLILVYCPANCQLVPFLATSEVAQRGPSRTEQRVTLIIAVM